GEYLLRTSVHANLLRCKELRRQYRRRVPRSVGTYSDFQARPPLRQGACGKVATPRLFNATPAPRDVRDAAPTPHPPVMRTDPHLGPRLRTSTRVAALTGAGISGERGIPTFSAAQSGLWARFRPEELASPEAFRWNPELVWDWYEWRRGVVARAATNPGH